MSEAREEWRRKVRGLSYGDEAELYAILHGTKEEE